VSWPTYNGLTIKPDAGGPPRFNGAVRLLPERLADVRKFAAGDRVFVTSMADLFYGDDQDRRVALAHDEPFNPVPVEFIAQVLAAIASRPDVDFITLTKRASATSWAVRTRGRSSSSPPAASSRSGPCPTCGSA
jgi:protein gp37